MREHPRRKTPHWSPRCSPKNQHRASSAATSEIERHVKPFSHFLALFRKHISRHWDAFGIGWQARVSKLQFQ